MTTSRRSFLAAIMGAIAAPVAAKLAPRLPEEPAVWNFGTWDNYVSYHYTVWDSLTISPGSVVNERLLPPPGPANFLIHSIGLHVNDAAGYRDVSEVSRRVLMNLKDGDTDLIEAAPLFCFGDGMAPTRLAVPYRFQRSDLGLYLNSQGSPIEMEAPVTVSVILSGIVQIYPTSGPRRGRKAAA